MGPMRGEDVVGLAAQQQVEGTAEDLAHGGARGLVEVGGNPTAERKAAGRVFLGAARRLHDAVEAGEGGYADLAHVGLSVNSGFVVPRTNYVTRCRQVETNIVRAGGGTLAPLRLPDGIAF